jgi:hypothetical protein
MLHVVFTLKMEALLSTKPLRTYTVLHGVAIPEFFLDTVVKTKNLTGLTDFEFS